jgi:hypothetical protein
MQWLYKYPLVVEHTDYVLIRVTAEHAGYINTSLNAEDRCTGHTHATTTFTTLTTKVIKIVL